MRRIFGVAIALGAFTLSPALAQDHHPHPGGNPHGSAMHAAPSHGSGPAHGGPAHAVHRPALSTVHRHTTHVVTEHRHATVYRTHTHHVTASHHAVTTRHVTTMRNVHAVAAHRASARELRRNFTASRRFHHGAYVRPAGWYAHRWVYGERLPAGWYGRSYWIVNFSLFGLVYPPDGYEWIRVGDDALLVDIYTGEVIRVEYAVFF
jgi:Ni/Co efflux regulator RcnB